MLVVQKYGGTSVGSVERIREVAKRCIATQKAGHDVVVIVSAMSGETNRLLKLAKEVNEDPPPDYERELDVIAATGEQVSVGLVSLAIQKAGGAAQSFLGSQVRIVTDSAFTRARIQSIDAQKIHDALKKGRIAVVAGFQGTDADGNITTLGRGGSDIAASPSRRRSRPTSARSTPTSTASTPAIPTWCRPRARSIASATRKCWSWRRWAPRCCRSARSSSA